RKGEKAKRNFEVQKIALELPKELLHRNINTRVDQMVEEGLVEEVQSLYKYRHLTALQTVGYKEIFAYLDDKISLAEAIEQIKVNTRQYAKRQVTWFKKDKEYQWLPPDENAVIDSLNKERL
ncbi:MAG TPA: tRNA dimethylallyltransferase, partial [Chitinophagaceae bacterium]